MRRLPLLLLAALLLASAAAAQAGGALELHRQALLFQASTDWYRAVELNLEALQANPAYAEPMIALSRCYYELGEYAQALSWIRKAAGLRSGSVDVINHEALVQVALGAHEEAAASFRSVLERQPNNLDARFGLALVDLALGKSAEALRRYEEALRIAPLNARALLSLAMVHSRKGNPQAGRRAIEEALRAHGSDPQVRYVAAYLASGEAAWKEAAEHCRVALSLDPSYADARRLLGAILLQTGDAAGAEEQMKDALARGDRSLAVWNVLGAARTALGRREEALAAYRSALAISPDDEVTRLSLERLLISAWKPEDKIREPWAEYHFKRGRELEQRSYRDLAAFEYRRGLKLYPYAEKGRLEYAQILRTQGYPSSYLEELRLLKDNGAANQAILDALETYESLLRDSVASSWGVDQFSIRGTDITLSLYVGPSGVNLLHPGAGEAVRSYLGDILSWNPGVALLPAAGPVSGFADAFRRAREQKADYFIILESVEDGQDFSLKASVYSGRTGAVSGSFQAFRTGNDRLRQSASRVAGLIVSSLPRRFSLARRKHDKGLATLGKLDSATAGDQFVIVRKGASSLSAEGFGLDWAPADEVGSFTVTRVDEEICEGTLKKAGFFDRINAGDEVVRKPPKRDPLPGDASGDGLYQEVRSIR